MIFAQKLAYSSMQGNLYPWHIATWQYLHQARDANKLAHALLFEGPPGLGKHDFIQRWVNALLCDAIDANGMPCSVCHACHLVQAQTHPNLLWVKPESSGQVIKIEQIRTLMHVVHQTGLHDGLFIVIIDPMDALNDYAANALLKTLEEPPSGVLFILVHEQLRPLLATILSRCQRVIFRMPEPAVASAWLAQALKINTHDQSHRSCNLLLKLARGAPLAAFHLASKEQWTIRQDILKTMFLLSEGLHNPLLPVTRWTEIDIFWIFALIQSVVIDILRLQHRCDVINEDERLSLQMMRDRCVSQQLFNFLDRLQQRRVLLLKHVNVNQSLQLESVLIDWVNVFVSQ